MFAGKKYLGAALFFRLVCGRSRYVHDLPKRAQRWHRSTVCGVHFALAAVHTTHALRLTAGDVAFMDVAEEPGDTERPIEVEDLRLRSSLAWTRANRIVRSDRFVIRRT